MVRRVEIGLAGPEANDVAAFPTQFGGPGGPQQFGGPGGPQQFGGPGGGGAPPQFGSPMGAKQMLAGGMMGSGSTVVRKVGGAFGFLVILAIVNLILWLGDCGYVIY